MKREVADSLGLLIVAIGVSIILVPIVNVGLTVFPFRPAGRDWRFGMWGFLLGAMTLPVLGVGLVGAGAVLRASRPVAVAGFVTAAVLTVLVAIGLVDFVTSGSALRAVAQNPQVGDMFGVELKKTSVISALTLPALIVMTLALSRLTKALGTEGPQSILQVGRN